MTINTDNLDFAPKDGKGPEMPKIENTKAGIGSVR